jgi:hypothetical protein
MALATRRAARFSGDVHALGAAHGLPVIFVLSGANEADLVIMTIGSPPWPGKLVGTAA